MTGEIGIVISARDEASKKISSVGQAAEQLPSHLDRATGALGLLQGAAGGMGGSAAQAATKLSGLGGSAAQAAAGLGGLGGSAAQAAAGLGGLGGASEKISSVGQAAKQLPSHLGRATGALILLEGAAGGMGGSVAQAVTKLSGLGAIIATGGPIGIALAALTAAVAAGSKMWALYTAETSAAESAVRSLDSVINASNDRLATQRTRVTELEEQLRFFGVTQEQVQLIKANEAIALQEHGTAVTEQEITTRRAALAVMEQELARREELLAAARRGADVQVEGTRALRTQIDEERGNLSVLERATASARQMGESRQREAAALSALIQKSKEEQAEKQKLIDAERRHREVIEARKRAQAAAAQAAIKAAQDQMAWDKQVADYAERLSYEKGEAIIAAAREAADAKALIQQERAEQEVEMNRAVGAAIQSAAQEASAAIIAGEEEGGKVAARIAIQTAETAVLAAASSAAAKQLDAHAYLPFIGIAVGSAAAAVIFALVKKQLAGIPKAHAGERIPGTREHLRIIQGGERILSRRETREMESGLGGRQSNLSIVAKIQNPEEMTDSQIKRWLSRINRQAEEMHRDGMFMATAAVK